MFSFPHTFVSILFILGFATQAATTLINITVDDTIGNQATGDTIQYEPAGVWKLGQDCTDCTATPDPSQIYDGTWHDGTFSSTSENGGGSNQLLSASLTFQGVSVYVFCLTIGTSQGPDGNFNMRFYIDGDLVGSYVKPPTGDPIWQYNVPVYVNESLPSGSHTFTLVNGVMGGNNTLTLLDYIVYTRDDASTSSSQSAASSSSSIIAASTSINAVSTSSPTSGSRIRAIIVPTVSSVGAVIVIAIIAVLYLCVRKRSRRAVRPPSVKENITESVAIADGLEREPLQTQQQVVPYLVSTSEVAASSEYTLKRWRGPHGEGGETDRAGGSDATVLTSNGSDGVQGVIPRVVEMEPNCQRPQIFASAHASSPPPSYYE